MSSKINVVNVKEQAPMQGPDAWFSGHVDLSMVLQQGEEPSNLSSGNVTFSPKARTTWHVHPRGQLLVVTAGKGFVQMEGEDAQIIKQGDVVWIPPKVKHWHGASVSESMTHIAIQESKDGTPVEWLEKVADTDYDKAL